MFRIKCKQSKIHVIKVLRTYFNNKYNLGIVTNPTKLLERVILML